MDSASYSFVLLGLAAAVLANLSQTRFWRSLVLLTSSLVFLVLMSRDWAGFLPLVGFLAFGYGLVVLVRNHIRVRLLSAGAVIFAFLWLKKYTFLPAPLFLKFPYFTLGISYIFFRVLHLVIECGDDADWKQIGPIQYLLYTLNFTTFVSGPIQRYDEFAVDQFAAEPISLSLGIICTQLERIIRGFFKVNVIASIFNMIRVDALAQLQLQWLSPRAKLFAAFCLMVTYPFFLYANFSGYIDIVIAIARLMRLRVPENFDRPFSADSFIDFWNRWHITLSKWLKDYVYNPLLLVLMRRVSSVGLQPLLGVISFFATFFLVGIWHGRTSEFVLFGVLQGAGVAVNKLWQMFLQSYLGRRGYRKLAVNPIYVAFGRGLTFSWFAFTLLWFWANWQQIHTVYYALGAAKWFVVWLAIVMSATAILSAWELLRSRLLSIHMAGEVALTSRYARVVYTTVFAVIAITVTVILNQAAPDIIYKAF